MGVIYKLKPEIKAYILEIKQAKPILSCRSLVALTEEKFKTRISKSSINSIIKEAGLSLPVGRRRKKRRRKLSGLFPAVIEPQIKALIEIPPEFAVEPSIRPMETPEAPPPPVEIPPETPLQVTSGQEIIPLPAPVEEPVETVEPMPSAEEIAATAPAAPIEALPPTTPSPIETPSLPAPSPSEVPGPPVTQPVISQDVTKPSPLQEEIPAVAEGLGTILLKAADYLLGGLYHITDAIQNRIQSTTPQLLTKTECLLYMPLFNLSAGTPIKPDCGLWPLLDKRFTSEEIVSYLNELQGIKELSFDIFQSVSRIFKEVRGIKVTLTDGSLFYLDGQLHTLWSAAQIPFGFATTRYNIKSYINRYFRENAPFVLFMAPGFDAPTKEFFEFMLSLDAAEKKIVSLALFGNKFEDLETIRLEETKKREFVVGLWPWQFGQFRKVKTIGEFKPFYFEALNKNFYLTEGQIELSQPNLDQKVTLRTCFVKTQLEDKIRLMIISNLPPEKAKIEALAEAYLSHWPNLEEEFHDFSRKIELFTYLASSQRFFSIDLLNFNKESLPDISSLLNLYLKVLDAYVRWHFLPAGYEDKDFSATKEQFYSLKAELKKQRTCIQVRFQPPSGYAFFKDLEYACHRLNEKEILFSDGKRLWFSVA